MVVPVVQNDRPAQLVAVLPRRCPDEVIPLCPVLRRFHHRQIVRGVAGYPLNGGAQVPSADGLDDDLIVLAEIDLLRVAFQHRRHGVVRQADGNFPRLRHHGLNDVV